MAPGELIGGAALSSLVDRPICDHRPDSRPTDNCQNAARHQDEASRAPTRTAGVRTVALTDRLPSARVPLCIVTVVSDHSSSRFRRSSGSGSRLRGLCWRCAGSSFRPFVSRSRGAPRGAQRRRRSRLSLVPVPVHFTARRRGNIEPARGRVALGSSTRPTSKSPASGATSTARLMSRLPRG